MDVFRHASNTLYGRKLSGEIRFAPMKPDEVSAVEWTDALGYDVDNLKHMPVTLGLTKWFLAGQKKDGHVSDIYFSPYEETSMCLASSIHDFAEAIVGDESALTKTAAFEKKEMLILRIMMLEIFSVEPVLATRIQEAIGDVLEDKTSKLGRAYGFVERMGYVRTAAIAWEQADAKPEPFSGALRELARDVVGHNVPKLVTVASEYPAINEFLTLHASTFEAIRASKTV